MNNNIKQIVRNPTAWLALGFVTFQYWILFFPQEPLIERTVHLVTALLLTFLVMPFRQGREAGLIGKLINTVFIAGIVAIGFYYWHELPRLSTRIENVSPIEWYDIAIAITLVAVLLEAVRRTVGTILLIVVVLFMMYGLFGHMIPGKFGFSSISIEEWSEILAMTTSGIMGVTTATSVNFIFYFIVFGVVYSAVGGGQLFIELAMRLVGKSRGGGAKVAIVGSSLMGTISGSAVANVTATGVFTIPLMRRTGIPGERAAAYEAIASTGGQLMPPIMGIAAFVMAEMLVVDYSEIALAGIFPALAFYFALFVFADLHARKTGAGTLTDKDFQDIEPVLPRLNMVTPPIVLVAALVYGLSAQIAVMWATVSCLVVPFLSPKTRYDLRALPGMIMEAGRQAATIAAPIMAIGIVISVAIQSNLALKFASGLISVGGGSYAVSLVLVVLGCIIMGMGLPTVAAYIIGAVLYVPALKELGVDPLQAHFFVMYFCVLSMVTPPVSLASFAAAGVAGTDAMKTSMVAFRICAVAFLIPFAFITDKALLFQGSYAEVAIAGAGLVFSTVIWAIGVTGFIVRKMLLPERILMMACGFGAMVMPTGSTIWIVGVGAGLVYIVAHILLAKNGGPSKDVYKRGANPSPSTHSSTH